MKIVATIEARSSSSRLPGKTMKKILDKPVLQLLIERIKNCESIDEIIIATSKNLENDVIEKLARELQIKCYRGSENDVLERVLNAAKSVNGDIIVELWGDNPLVDSDIINKLVDYYEKNEYDCIGTNLPNFKKTFPIGLTALIFSTEILEQVEKITDIPYDRENVSNYIYEHPEKYKIAALPCPSELNYPKLRLTIDEQNDFDLIKIIFENLFKKNSQFSASDVIKFLNSNKNLIELNKHINQNKLKL